MKFLVLVCIVNTNVIPLVCKLTETCSAWESGYTRRFCTLAGLCVFTISRGK